MVQRHFDNKDILVLDQKALKNDVLNVVNGIFDWLGIEDLDFIDARLKNVGGNVRFKILNEFLFGNGFFKNAIKPVVRFFIPSRHLSQFKEMLFMKNVKKDDGREPEKNSVEEDKVREYLELIYSQK